MTIKKYLFALLFILIHVASDAQKLTRSEALLSGLEKIPMAAVFYPKLDDSWWPTQIDIPQGWRDGFKELIRLTKETGQEHGACLSVVQKQAADNAQAQLTQLLAYEKLMGARTKLNSLAFEQQANAIREKIEILNTPSGPQQLQWSLGNSQKGNERSIHVELNTDFCAGNSIGDVHTHPTHLTSGLVESAQPSQADVINVTLSIGASDQNTTFVVESISNKVCAVIKAKALQFSTPTGHDQIRKQALYLQENLSSLMSNQLSRQHTSSSNDENPQRGVAIANFLVPYHAALYCGSIDTSLKRIAPMPLANDMRKGSSVLAIKALLAAKKYAFNLPTPELNIDFSPTFDLELTTYLKTHSLNRFSVDKGAPTFLKKIHEQNAEEILLSELNDYDIAKSTVALSNNERPNGVVFR